MVVVKSKWLFLCVTAFIFLGFAGCAETVTGVWTEVYSYNTDAEIETGETTEPVNDMMTATDPVYEEDAGIENHDPLDQEVAAGENQTAAQFTEEDAPADGDEDAQSYAAETERETEYSVVAANPIPHQGDSERKLVALTFDDGPIQYTEGILDILERYGGRATFCVLGDRVESWAGTIQRAASLGHEIVGHSWDHANFTMISEDNIAEQILFTSAAIESAIGAMPPRLFRAPYGRVNEDVVNVAERLGYAMLHWSIDPRDWERRDPEYVYHYIIENAVHGAIFILHDIRPTTMEAMEKVVPALIEQGFDLVTASELIEYVYGEIVPGEMYKGLS